ncbi:MAG: efflux RND transporter periplasmic adaptor subunit [Planctomycetota bacterium]
MLTPQPKLGEQKPDSAMHPVCRWLVPSSQRSRGTTARRWQRLEAKAWLALLTVIILLTSVSRATAADDFEVTFIDGFSKPFRVSQVAARTNGVILERVAAEGSFVHAGQKLAQLDDRSQRKQADVAQLSAESKGELLSAKSELDARQSEVAILKDLLDRRSATPEELKRAQMILDVAEANYQTTVEKLAIRKAEHGKILTELENYSVRAPFDGVLVEYLKETGEFVGSVDPAVCVVADLSALSINFMVPRNYRVGLRVGDELPIQFVDSKQSVKGKIYYISPYTIKESNTFAVRLKVENQDLKLNAGERCQIERYRPIRPDQSVPDLKTQQLIGHEQTTPAKSIQ